MKDILNIIKDQKIRIVDFKMTDVDGRWRHLSIPAERFSQETMESGIGFDLTGSVMT